MYLLGTNKLINQGKIEDQKAQCTSTPEMKVKT